jgi:hypothetical protein
MNEAINTLLQASPPLALALAINLLVFFLKKAKRFPDDYLPVAAMFIGAMAYPWIADVTNAVPSVKSPFLYNTVIGAAIGGLSVAFNQQFRQLFGLKTGQTVFLDKPQKPAKKEVRP